MTTTFALEEAAARGDYHEFRKLLSASEQRLLHRALRRPLEPSDAQESVDCAIELAFRGFDERPVDCTLDEWLNRLLAAALRTRTDAAEVDGHA